MITKAIIEQVIDNKTYKIRIPTLDKLTTSSISTNSLHEATVSSQLNSSLNLNIGDIVFVDFEDSSYLSPVILGILCVNSNILSKSNIVLNSINVLGNAKLPYNTRIGDIDYQNIVCLTHSNENIQKQLDDIISDIDNLNNSINENIKLLDNADNNISSYVNYVKSVEASINNINITIGEINSDDTNTIFGKLNILSEQLNEVLKRVGQFDTNNNFFDRLESLKERLLALKSMSPKITISDSNS